MTLPWYVWNLNSISMIMIISRSCFRYVIMITLLMPVSRHVSHVCVTEALFLPHNTRCYLCYLILRWYLLKCNFDIYRTSSSCSFCSSRPNLEQIVFNVLCQKMPQFIWMHVSRIITIFIWEYKNNIKWNKKQDKTVYFERTNSWRAQPYLEYAVPIWNPFLRKDINKLKVVQHRAIIIWT